MFSTKLKPEKSTSSLKAFWLFWCRKCPRLWKRGAFHNFWLQKKSPLRDVCHTPWCQCKEWFPSEETYGTDNRNQMMISPSHIEHKVLHQLCMDVYFRNLQPTDLWSCSAVCFLHLTADSVFVSSVQSQILFFNYWVIFCRLSEHLL